MVARSPSRLQSTPQNLQIGLLLRNQTPPHPLPNRVLRETLLNNVSLSYTSREEIEVYRFSLPVSIAVPLLAIFLQAFLPLRFPFLSIFDLPLLVVLFLAMARRSQVA